MVMRFSFAEPGPGGAPVGVAVYAPVLRACDCCHDIESVGATVIARSETPWTAGVFYFDPDVTLVEFGAEGELAAVAGGAVQDGIGGELRGDQDRVVGQRAAVKQRGERGPRVPDLGGVSGVGAGITARACRRDCRGHCLSPGRVFVFPACRERATVGNRIGPDAH